VTLKVCQMTRTARPELLGRVRFSPVRPSEIDSPRSATGIRRRDRDRSRSRSQTHLINRLKPFMEGRIERPPVVEYFEVICNGGERASVQSSRRRPGNARTRRPYRSLTIRCRRDVELRQASDVHGRRDHAHRAGVRYGRILDPGARYMRFDSALSCPP
jgi:hypothetical protein